jgi:hypothetical protein
VRARAAATFHDNFVQVSVFALHMLSVAFMPATDATIATLTKEKKGVVLLARFFKKRCVRRVRRDRRGNTVRRYALTERPSRV